MSDYIFDVNQSYQNAHRNKTKFVIVLIVFIIPYDNFMLM